MLMVGYSKIVKVNSESQKIPEKADLWQYGVRYLGTYMK